MIIVLEDKGLELEFPDDMPLDQVKAAIDKQFYAPKEEWKRPEPQTSEEMMSESTVTTEDVIEGTASMGLKAGESAMRGTAHALQGLAQTQRMIGRGAVQDQYGVEMEPAVQAKPTDASAPVGPAEEGMEPFGLSEQADKLANVLVANADRIDQSMKDFGIEGNEITDFIAEAAGYAGPGIAEFIAGPQWALVRGVSAAQEAGAGDALYEGAKAMLKREILGQIFHQVAPLKASRKVPAVTAIGTAQAVAEGQTDPKEALREGLTLGIMELGLGGAGKMGVRDVIAQKRLKRIMKKLGKEAAEKELREPSPAQAPPEGWVEHGKMGPLTLYTAKNLPKDHPANGATIAIKPGENLAEKAAKVERDFIEKGTRPTTEMLKDADQIAEAEAGPNELPYHNPFKEFDPKDFDFVDEMAERESEFDVEPRVSAGLSIRDMGNKKYVDDTLKATDGKSILPGKAPGDDVELFNPKTGRPAGNPTNINSEGEYNARIRKMVDDAKAHGPENLHTAFWYEDVGETVRKLFRLKQRPDGTWEGDLEGAERMVRLLTYYSASNSVGGNAVATVNSIYEMMRGNESPALGRFPNVSKELMKPIMGEAEITAKTRGYSNKTASFYRNIAEATFLTDSGAVTLDVWMSRNMDFQGKGGKIVESFSDKQYAFGKKMVEDATRLFNKETGQKLSPRQMQALIWSYEQGGRTGEKRGKGAYEEFFGKQTITGETVPSKSIEGNEALHNASPEVKDAFTRDQLEVITGDKGQDLIMETLGGPLYWQELGKGTYEGAENPNILTTVVQEGKKTSGFSEDLGSDYADAFGYIFSQDATPWFAPADKGPNRAWGVKLTPKGFEFDGPARAVFYKNLKEVLPGGDYTFQNGDLIVINYRDSKTGKPYGPRDPEFLKLVTQAAEKTSAELGDKGIEHGVFRARTGYPESVWDKDGNYVGGKENSEGGRDAGYKERLLAKYGPDILARLDSLRAQSKSRAAEFVEALRKGEARGAEAEPGSEGAAGRGRDQRVEEVARRTDEFITGKPVGLSTQAVTTSDVIRGLDSVSPEVEARLQAAKGLRGPGIVERFTEGFKNVYRHFTRAKVLLDPRTDGVIIDILRKYQEVPEISKAEAFQVIKGLTAGMGPNKYKLFSRFLLTRDLLADVEGGLYERAFDPERPTNVEQKELPFAYKDKGEIEKDLDNYTKLLEENPDVKEAVERRNDFMNALKEDLINEGLLDPEIANRDDYWHHQVLAYMSEGEQYTGTSSADVRLHKKGWQRKRAGSEHDYNTEYVEAEFEVIAQALSQLKTKEVLKAIDRESNIAESLKKQAKLMDEANKLAYEKALADPNISLQEKVRIKAAADAKTDWKTLLPEGYVLWQPERGNWFYQANSLSERQLDKLANDLARVVEIPGEGYRLTGEEKDAIIKQVLAVGGKKPEWALPERVAKTLDSYRDFSDKGWLSNVSRGAMSSWKQWTLLNPIRVLRYNLNNTSGDLDIAIAYNPRILKEAGRAAKELWDWHMNKGAFNKDIREALERGVLTSGLSINEIPDISKEGILKTLTNARGEGYLRRYWNTSKDFTQWRENILRLSAYRHFKAELAKGKKMYGASRKSELDAMYEKEVDSRDIAAKLARELIGDYGNVSEGGQWLRNHLRPFHSWTEINMPRYVRLIRNAPLEGGSAAGAAGRKAAGTSLRLGAKMFFLYGMVQAWNHFRYPELEDKLADYERRQGHIILGENEDGTIKTVRFQGALGDALNIFGLDTLPEDIREISAGEKTFAEQGIEMAKSPVNLLWQGIRPEKALIESIAGKTTYPDVFNPREIRDKKEAIAKIVSADMLYRRVTGKPSRPLARDLRGTYAYESDPGESSYNSIRGLGYEWNKKHGKEFSGGSYTEKSNALYYYRQAIKYGDQPAAEKYLARYFELGGNEKGMAKSIERAHPLAMIKKDEQEAFVESLSPRQKKALERAIAWYEMTYKGEKNLP